MTGFFSESLGEVISEVLAWFSSHRREARRLLLVLTLVGLGLNAWVADDAFITFRTLDQLDAENGPRWNPHERVQAYTHPLWLWTLWLATRGLESPFFAALLLGWVFSFLAILILERGLGKRRGGLTGVLAILACVSSKAFMDYTTSGLETSLTYLLLAVVLTTSLRFLLDRPTPLDLGVSCLGIALLATNRLDTLTLTAPLLILLLGSGWRRLGRARTLWLAVLSSLPLLASSLFSLLYYGFPFPNTFYAKVVHDTGVLSAVAHGVWYVLVSVLLDPLLGVVLTAGLVLGLRERTGVWGALSLGVTLNLAYVLAIGGDFMAGRFLVPAFVVSLFVVLNLSGQKGLARLTVLLVVLLISPVHPLSPFSDRYGGIPILGVSDERAHYSDATSLEACVVSLRVDDVCPDHAWTWMGRDFSRSSRKVETVVAAGIFGYAAGTEKIVVDRIGLADPLLARMPVAETSSRRTGHLVRVVPAGYVEGLRQGVNGIHDADLREYNERLRIVTQGPLWSSQRLRTILRFNLGAYDHLLESFNTRARRGEPSL